MRIAASIRNTAERSCSDQSVFEQSSYFRSWTVSRLTSGQSEPCHRRALQEARREDGFVQKREVQIIAQANRAAMDMLDTDVSGSLSLARNYMSPVMFLCRGKLRTIDARCRTCSCSCPPTRRLPRRRLPPLCWRSRSMLNGDIADTHTCEHYCAYACCRSFAQTELRLRTIVPWSFLPHKTS